ncbi:flagellar motor protein MotB [Desulforegula conservatrix]|uniref:flagellar motor protein MotB n=1 Tax=Desulforegula conservatrix TaxID=153026 RepID=UPI0003F55F5E|nr:flagellar motor protein MotB [Desulforegula conservatrix]
MAKADGDKGGKKESNIIIKKVKKISGGAHGGAWKVAYADFVTAMMAFFLLMWLIAAMKPQTKAAVAAYFKSDSKLAKGGPATPEVDVPPTSPEDKPDVGEGLAEAMELQQDIEEIIESKLSDLKDQIIVELANGNVRIEIVDKERNPLFQVGSSALNDNAKKIIKELTKAVVDVPNKLIIEGHTDSLNFAGSKYTNWELSTERASAARQVLESSGMNQDRIVMVAGYAANIPLIKNDPANPENRRISIVILSKNTKSYTNLYK